MANPGTDIGDVQAVRREELGHVLGQEPIDYGRQIRSQDEPNPEEPMSQPIVHRESG